MNKYCSIDSCVTRAIRLRKRVRQNLFYITVNYDIFTDSIVYPFNTKNSISLLYI